MRQLQTELEERESGNAKILLTAIADIIKIRNEKQAGVPFQDAFYSKVQVYLYSVHPKVIRLAKFRQFWVTCALYAKVLKTWKMQ